MSGESTQPGWWQSPDGDWYPNHPALHGMAGTAPRRAEADEPQRVRVLQLPVMLAVALALVIFLAGAVLAQIV